MKCITTLEYHDSVSSLCWTDKYLASGSYDDTIKIWDLDTKKCIATLEGHRHVVTSLCWTGKYLVSGSYDKTIKIWDIVSGWRDETRPQKDLVLGWRDETRPQKDLDKCIATLEGHCSRITSLCWTGKYLVSGGWDKTIKIWDLVSGWRVSSRPRKDLDTNKCITTFGGSHKNLITSLCWTGTYLVSGSYDGTIKIWDWNTFISNYERFFTLAKLRIRDDDLDTPNTKVEHTFNYVIKEMNNDLFINLLSFTND